jgi:hypothetical protein
MSSTDARVILDATIMVTPAGDQGLPLQFGPGRLIVSARLADEAVKAPTVFILRSDHNADPGANVEMPVSTGGQSTTVDLAGGIYACNLHVNAPTPGNATLADVAHQAQFVALRITFAPR